MRKRSAAVGAALAAVLSVLALAAGCSGGGAADATGGRSPGTGSPAPSAGGPAELPPSGRLPVPSGFDNTRGWTEAVFDRTSRTRPSWAVAPASAMVVRVADAEGTVRARALANGAETWRYRPRRKLDRARTALYITAGPGGEEYAIVVREGVARAEGRTRTRSLVTVDTVPVASTGEARAARHKEYQDAEAGPFTGRLLITTGNGSGMRALDPLTGEEQSVERFGEVRLARRRTADLPPGADCSADTETVFATEAGPVAVYTQDGYCDYRWQAKDYVPCGKGFTVGGAWRSEKAAVDRAAAATPLAVVGRYLVVAWSDFPGARSAEASKKDVVAVHSLADGSVVARTDCDITGAPAGRGSVKPLAAQPTSQLSPDGEFLVSGQVGFDLAAKRGWCFADTSEERGVTLTAVSGTGRAYGITYSESTWADVPYGSFPYDYGTPGRSMPGRVVAVDLTTGAVGKELARGTALPVHISKDTGLFLLSGTLAGYPGSTDSEER